MRGAWGLGRRRSSGWFFLGLRRGVIAIPAPWVAAHQALGDESQSFEQGVILQAQAGILGTRG